MATLLSLGRRVINMDLVCEIEDYDDRIRLFYAVCSSDSAGVQQLTYADIDGAEAEAMRSWLSEHAIQLVAPASEPVSREPIAPDERTRLLQAAVAAGEPERPATDDNPFYGEARLRQMRGIGSDTRAESSDQTTPDDRG